MKKIICDGKNLYVEKKKPQGFQELAIENKKIYMDGKEILSSAQIYACLHYDKLKNISFVVRETECYTASFLFGEKKNFEEFLNLICGELPEVQVSAQNKKINGYAAALASKLQQGIETTVIDAKDEEEIICCPVCGMQCDPNIPYCMECGTAV